MQHSTLMFSHETGRQTNYLPRGHSLISCWWHRTPWIRDTYQHGDTSALYWGERGIRDLIIPEGVKRENPKGFYFIPGEPGGAYSMTRVFQQSTQNPEFDPDNRILDSRNIMCNIMREKPVRKMFYDRVWMDQPRGTPGGKGACDAKDGRTKRCRHYEPPWLRSFSVHDILRYSQGRSIVLVRVLQVKGKIPFRSAWSADGKRGEGQIRKHFVKNYMRTYRITLHKNSQKS